MTWNTVTVERSGTIAVVRMNRPAHLNAFDAELSEELSEAGRAFHRDYDVHAVILTGNDRAFSAGADLKEERKETSLAEQRERSQLGRQLCRAWEEMPRASIHASSCAAERGARSPHAWPR